MAKAVYAMVAKCKRCVRNGNYHRHSHSLKIRPATDTLEFAAMNILGPLPRTTPFNQYVIVRTGRYSKSTRAISTSKTTSARIANVFLDYWIVSFSMQTYLLSDTAPQFVKKFFRSISGYLDLYIIQPLPTIHRRTVKPSGITKRSLNDFNTTSQIIIGSGTYLYNH